MLTAAKLFKAMGCAARAPIGIDVGARSVKAVQLAPARGAGRGWRVTAAVSLPRLKPGTPIAPDEALRLYDTLARQGFSNTDAVLAVPDDKLLGSVLELPPRSSNAPVDQIARIELARTHRLAPDSIEMGCWDLPVAARANKATAVMAVACGHADANALLDTFDSQGFNVRALDVRACALARACAPLCHAGGGVTAILDIGWTSAALSLLHRDSVVYTRIISEAGVVGLYDVLGRRLKLDTEVIDYVLAEIGLRPQAAGKDGSVVSAGGPDLELPAEAAGLIETYVETAVQELKTSFSYAVHQYPDAAVSRLLLVGGGASIPGVAAHLGGVLGIETRTAALTDLAECPPQLLETCGSAALTAAAGLAMFPDA